MALKINNTVRSYIVDNGIVGAITPAELKIYGGTRPTTAGGTAGTQEIIVTISSITWATASNGTAAISATKTGTAGTNGTPSWARLSDSTGTSSIIDGVCGTASTGDFVIDAPTVSFGAVVSLTSATIIQPSE